MTFPSCWALVMLAGHLLRQLATAADRIGEPGEVVGGDDLADSGAQSLAKDPDVQPSTQEDHADIRAVHADVLGEVAGALHVDVRADEDEVLGR